MPHIGAVSTAIPWLLLLHAAVALTYSSSSPLDADHPSPGLPFVINTWSGPFLVATNAAFDSLASSSSDAAALDAIEAGCRACESSRCDGTVGYGGSPDEQCETTLDALIMDGGGVLNVGAVAGLRRVRHATSVARAVLDHTEHSLLVGDLATKFAVENGFVQQGLGTEESARACEEWERGGCQGNYRVNVTPDPDTFCGPYTPNLADSSLSSSSSSSSPSALRLQESHPHTSHDTLAIIAISASGAMAAGTTTNGAAHKIPGRAGDAPIPGSGAYVDSLVGGCGATGDGDIMMRFLPCYQAVESMRRGMTPAAAAEDAVRRMAARASPGLKAGLVVTDRKGRHGGAAVGWSFTYSFRGGGMDRAEVVHVEPVSTTRPWRSEL